MQIIQSILVVGGTHGNELTGINVVQALQANPQLIEQAPQLDINYVLANEKAIEQRVRYTEVDLNRQFTLATLTSDIAQADYETQLAVEFNALYGPKGNSQTDLVIDIHNTTSSMGPTIIMVEDSPFYQQWASYLKYHEPSVNILLEDNVPYLGHPYLCTVGRYGMMIEIGAQAQNTSRADHFQICLRLLALSYQFIDQVNQQQLDEQAAVETFLFTANVPFPTDDNGRINGLIHESLLGGDFCQVMPGDPLFRMFDGTVKTYQGAEPFYPHFINEAAYLETQVAYAGAKKIYWSK